MARRKPSKQATTKSEFQLRKDGIYWRNASGEMEYFGPWLKILAVASTMDGSDWSKLLVFRDHLGKLRRVLVSDSWLHDGGHNLIRLLSNAGYKVPMGRRLNQALLEYIDAQCVGRPHLWIVRQLGWHGDGTFLLPHRCFGPKAKSFYLDCSALQSPDKYRESSSLKEWQAQIARPCAGNLRLEFALCVALSGPLLELFNSESGIFAFVGRTSQGKSTALQLAGSVWGGRAGAGSELGFTEHFLATVNAFDRIAASGSSTLVCLDETELAGNNPKEAADLILRIIYRLLGNSSKRRLDNDPQLTWRIMVLISSEKDLATIAAEGGRSVNPEQLVRYAEIPVNSDKPIIERVPEGFGSASEFVNLLKDRCRQYHGTAGVAFVEALVQELHDDRDALMAKLHRYRNHFLEVTAANRDEGAEIRTAERFALVYAAGRLAKRYGVLPAEFGVLKSVKRCYLDHLEHQLGPAQLEQRIVDHVTNCLHENIDQFVNTIDGRSKLSTLSDDCWGIIRSHKTDGVECLVRPAVFTGQICKPYGFKRTAEVLIARGLLRHQKDKTSVTREFKGIAERRFYCLDDSLLP